MSIHQERSRQIVETIAGIKKILAGGTEIEHLNEAKALLMDLAARSDLFPHADFSDAEASQADRTYRLYEEDGGEFALYLAIVSKGVTNTPHDHGNSWAIIAAVDGLERHHLYKRIDDGQTDGIGQLEYAGDLMVEQGTALSMLIGGIHSIEGVSEEPNRNLHLYGHGFEHQAGRREFDLDNGTYVHSYDAAGTIEDFPLHPAALS